MQPWAQDEPFLPEGEDEGGDVLLGVEVEAGGRQSSRKVEAAPWTLPAAAGGRASLAQVPAVSPEE